MLKKLVVAASVALLVSGCASVPMEPKDVSESAKRFGDPSDGQAGLYVYRNTAVGQALKKDIWIDGECLGESANNVFFHTEVPGDKEYTISTESEFSPNSLQLLLERGKNYFVRQYIKLGVFVGGADLEVIEPEKAKEAIAKLDLAKKGACSRAFPTPSETQTPTPGDV